MRRLYTIDEFAKLPDQQRDAESLAVTTTLFEPPEFGESGRLVTYTFSTPAVGRDLHTVASDAWQLANFEKNPVFIWFHDDSLLPIGRVIDIGDVNGSLKGTVEYADRDLNPFADMVYRMVKARYINAVSTSWQPIAWKFSTDKARAGGVDFSKVDLLEISQVPIPALPAALAEARANGIDTTPMVTWAERLLDTGGMTLVPRTELETLRRAATMKKPTKPTPGTANAGDAADAVRRALKTKHDRALSRAPKAPVFQRGLYDVAQLCYALSQLGYLHDSAEYEAALEEDESPVPAMLGEGLVKIGEALIAMTTEEVHELLDDHDEGEEDGEDEAMEAETRALPAEERTFIAEGKTVRARAWRSGVAIARAGKALSKSNEEKLQDAQDHHERAMKHHKALGDHQEAVGEHVTAAQGHHERATKTLEAIGEHLRTIQNPASPEDGDEALDEAVKYHRAATGHLDKLGTEHTDMADRNEDVGDSNRAMGRSVKSAQRCVRSVVDGAETTEPDSEDADDLKKEEAAKEEKARRLRRAKALKLRGAAA
jgi:Caudovirus prohead serine protease